MLGLLLPPFTDVLTSAFTGHIAGGVVDPGGVWFADRL